MSMDQILMNLRNAFQKVIAYRVIVSSPMEKVADLPLLILVLVALMAPVASVIAAVVALITGHKARLEKDFIIRT